MKTLCIEAFAMIFTVMLIAGLMPITAHASDNVSLQELSQAWADIAEEVTQSVVSIKVERQNQPRSEKREYFERYLPKNFRWRWEEFRERDSEPKRRRFFFDGDDIQKLPEMRGLIEALPVPRFREQHAVGAGIIINTDGYIVTANHLVEKAESITVTLSDKRAFEAKVIGTDRKTGVAVVKVDIAPGELSVARLGDSDSARVGELVLAIGHPFGFQNTVSCGVISGLGRNQRITEYDNLIQTDAVIGPGSDGGALVNARGEVIGMNIAMSTGDAQEREYQGIGFAIPINMVKDIAGQLIEHGKVERGWFGTYIQDISHDMAKKLGLESTAGAMVSEIQSDSPAEAAGIEDGDVIIAFDGQSVDDVQHLRFLVAATKPETTVTVTVMRYGQKKDIEVTIGAMSSDTTEHSAKPKRERERVRRGRLGVEIQDVDEDLAEKLQLEEPRGALVSQVIEDSPAEKADIKTGDVIVTFDGQAVEDTQHLKNLIAKTEAGKTIAVIVIRDGEKKDIEITIRKKPSKPAKDKGTTWRGMTVQKATDKLARKYRIKPRIGIVVTSVESDSPADKAGLRPGDRILKVEKQPINNMSEFQDAVKDVKKYVMLYIKRGDRARFVIVK